jgi:hypothetical protein
MKMKMTKFIPGKRKKQSWPAPLLLCLVFLMLLRNPLKHPRNLQGTYVKVTTDEDVSPEVEEAQKQARIQAECTKILPPPQIWGTEHEDSHVTELSCVYTHYRIPRASVENIDNPIVFGVLSHGPLGRSERDTIRETWGKGQKVFFLVAGNWEDIQNEYNELGDLIWVDQKEIYRDGVSPKQGALTFKTQVAFAAMHDIVMKENPNVKYFFKTDTDTYINMALLEHELNRAGDESPVDYWGECHSREKPYRNVLTKWFISFEDYPYTYYPNFCVGHGYLVSRNFLNCVVGEGHLAKVNFMTNEDGATGLLAEKCGIEPSLSGFRVFRNVSIKQVNDFPIQTNVKSNEAMLKLHETYKDQLNDLLDDLNKDRNLLDRSNTEGKEDQFFRQPPHSNLVQKVW